MSTSGARLDHRQLPGSRSRTGSAANPPAMRRKRSTASGRSRYQTQVPRRSELTQPDSRSTLRWWLTVGWRDVAAGSEIAGADLIAGRELAEDRESRRVGGALEEQCVGIGGSLHPTILTSIDMEGNIGISTSFDPARGAT